MGWCNQASYGRGKNWTRLEKNHDLLIMKSHFAEQITSFRLILLIMVIRTDILLKTPEWFNFNKVILVQIPSMHR